MSAFPIHPKSIDAIWPAVEPMIAEACKTSRGRFGTDYWHEFCKGSGTLWVATNIADEINAVAIAMIMQQGARRICRMRGVSGENMPSWVSHISDVEQWAKSNGCDGMEIVGGRGWERVLKPYGYSLTHVVLEKDFFDG